MRTLPPAYSPGAPATESTGFQELFRELLHRPEATAVMQGVARAVDVALVAEGYLPGEWASGPSTQFEYARGCQWTAPFRDPLANVGFVATVRLFAMGSGGIQRGAVWVDLCRRGEAHRHPGGVSRSMLDVSWADEIDAETFVHEMVRWAHPANAAAISALACDLVAELTTILAP